MLSKEKSPLKLLPCGATKQRIAEMYPREPETYLRKLMQSIQIETNPHLNEADARNRKRLTRRELEKLIDVLGTPKGYSGEFMEA